MSSGSVVGLRRLFGVARTSAFLADLVEFVDQVQQ
jgi:hypothetical protein